MIPTANVILTKNPKTMEDFFSGRYSLGKLKSDNTGETFVFSNGPGSNLISFSETRDVGSSGKFIISLEFIDPDQEFELRSFKQTLAKGISTNYDDFVGDGYLLAYGVGYDQKGWSGSNFLTLTEINFNPTEGRVFKLTFESGMEINAFRTFNNKEVIGWDFDSKACVKSIDRSSLISAEGSDPGSKTLSEIMIADAFIKQEKVASSGRNYIFLPNELNGLPALTEDELFSTTQRPQRIIVEGRVAYVDTNITQKEAKAKKLETKNQFETSVKSLSNLGVYFNHSIDTSEEESNRDGDEIKLNKEGFLATESSSEELVTYSLHTPLGGQSEQERVHAYRVYRQLGDKDSDIVFFEETDQSLLLAWQDAFKDAPEGYGPIQRLRVNEETKQILPTIVIGDRELIARHLYLKQGAPKKHTLSPVVEKYLGSDYKNNKLVRKALLVNGRDLPETMSFSFGATDSVITKLDITSNESYLSMLRDAQESILSNLRKNKFEKKSNPTRPESILELINTETSEGSSRSVKDVLKGLVSGFVADEETRLKRILVTSDEITSDLLTPAILDKFKRLHVNATVETLPLFQYSGYKLLEQKVKFNFNEVPIFRSKGEKLASSFYSGTYQILGYSHNISSKELTSTFTLMSILDKEDVEAILEDESVFGDADKERLYNIFNDYLKTEILKNPNIITPENVFGVLGEEQKNIVNPGLF